MISLTCTQCQAVLTLDEAFAGGVCRCQYCGAIQTVPSHLKHSGSSTGQSSGLTNQVAAGAGNGSKGGAKTLYQNRTGTATGAAVGSGLDAIAEVVASSGLSGSGLTSGRMRKPLRKEPTAQAIPPAAKNKLTLLLVVSGGVIVLLVGIIIWLATRGGGSEANNGSTPPASAGTGGTNLSSNGTAPPRNSVASTTPPRATPTNHTPNNTPAVPANVTPRTAPNGGPNYFGINLEKEQSVVFLLDRGSATRVEDRFNSLKLACFRSIDSLGPSRKFQVILWNNDSTQPDVASPASLSNATRENAETCRADLDVVNQGSSSSVNSALEKALAQNPSAVILATAKNLDDNFVKTVMDLRAGKPVRLYGIAVGGNPATAAALEKIAQQTGGQMRDVNDTELGEAVDGRGQ